MRKKPTEQTGETQPTQVTIPTVEIAAVEYEQLRAKAEMYDLVCGINQANQRIAMLERFLAQKST